MRDILNGLGLDQTGDLLDFQFWSNIYNNYYNIPREKIKEKLLKEFPELNFPKRGDITLNGTEILHVLWYIHNNLEKILNNLIEIYYSTKNKSRSKFNTLDELEENLTVKQVKNGGAKEFYLDETKPMSERVKAFNEYGGVNIYKYRPITKEIKDIFDWYYYTCCPNKMETILTASVIIDFWMVEIERCKTIKIDGIFEESERKYKPSKEALERLENYYLNKLMLEGVAKFTYDW
jgi:hypothetical protein